MLTGIMTAGAQTEPPTLFATITADRTRIFAGEKFNLLLSIHARDVNLDKQITVSGLSDTLALEPPDELPLEFKTFGSRVYEIRRYRYAARASLPGTFTPKPVLAGQIITVEQSFVFTRRQIHPVSIPVQARAITIRPIPAGGRPDGFSGVVGRDITLSAAIEPSDVAVGELIVVSVTISGDGIPPGIAPPLLAIDPTFKTYPAKPSKNSPAGARTFEQIVIPSATNATTVGPVTFIYFDTRSEEYRTLSQGPFPVTFHPERQVVTQVYRPPAGGTTNSGTMAVIGTDTNAVHHGNGSRWRRWFGRIGIGRDSTQRAVITAGPVEARFAPSPNAQPLGKIPRDTTVAVVDSTPEWLRVVTPGGDAGWIPRTAATVIPR